MTTEGEKNSPHANIAVALAAAQAEMEPARKDGENDAFKRNGKATAYATLASVLDACVPALTRHGIALIQPTGENEHGRYVETILLHASGETLSCRVPLIIGRNDMQGYGSAVTYARRYGLMCMAGIAPEDDDGNAAAQAAPRQQEPRLPARDVGPDPVQIAVESLGAADTLETLALIWKGLGPVQKDARVIAAKDARKAELTPAITDDQIPY